MTGNCDWCPIGSYTDTDEQEACTPCATGQTTLAPGSTACVGKILLSLHCSRDYQQNCISVSMSVSLSACPDFMAYILVPL